MEKTLPTTLVLWEIHIRTMLVQCAIMPQRHGDSAGTTAIKKQLIQQKDNGLELLLALLISKKNPSCRED